MPRITTRLGIVVAALLTAGTALADQLPRPKTPWLFGDWLGWRPYLSERGIDFQFGYINELAGNAQGGLRRWTDYADQIQAGVTFDLERLAGMRDARFQISYTERTGRNLVTDAGLNTLQLVQEIYGRGQTARLTEFYFDQKYFNGLVDWKVGRMGVGDDFAAFSCNFQNLTFCGSDPGNIVGYYIFNWPISQWGSRVKLDFTSSYFQLGAYDQNQQYLGVKQALLPVVFPNSSGVLTIGEFGVLSKFANGLLPGSYKFGAWYSTASADDVFLDVEGTYAAITGLPPRLDRGLYGAYINFEQQITRTPGWTPNGGLSVFLNAVIADRKTAVTDFQIAAGLVFKGPFSLRPKDDIAFAFGTTHVNTRLAQVQALENSLGLGPVGVQHFEYVLETYYTFVVDDGLRLRPNIQYIIDPGGISQSENVLVFGLKTVASF